MSSLGTYLEYIGHNGIRVPRGHWTNKENHKKFMDWLRKKEGYNTMEDLYKINIKVIIKNGGRGLLATYYNDSITYLMSKMYPDYNWLLFRFSSKVPKDHWDNIENQKQFMDWLRKKEGYNTMEDLYKINTKVIRKYGGGGLLGQYYNDSFTKLLKALYPNYNWFEWKFYNVKRGFWKNKENHKKYIEWLKQELGYTNMEDLYKMTCADIENNYGGGLIQLHYNYSPIAFVTSMYPNYNWIMWKFRGGVPQRYWQSKENCLKYIEWLKQELGYTNMEDLYKMSRRDFQKNYGEGMFCSFEHSFIKMATELYPNYNWDISKFNSNKTEAIIHRFLVNNKSNIDIKKFVSQYKPDWSKNPDTGRYLPYDFCIELVNDKKIIIECDGVQHYTENSHFHRNDWTLEKQQDRDIFKMNKALENDVSVIRIEAADVYNDRINWEKELTDAINEIKNDNEVSIKLLGCLKNKVCWRF